jgi:deoxyadenosine/deoxycytidine kinase
MAELPEPRAHFVPPSEKQAPVDKNSHGKVHVSFSGLPGTGKTHFVDAVSQSDSHEFCVAQEPHEANAYLGDFYRDPIRFAFRCQLQFLSLTVDEFEKVFAESSDNAVILSDRSIAEGRVFVDALLEEGILNADDFELYGQLYKKIERTLPDKHRPDVVVFLDATVETCLARIRKRGREIESNINERYLGRLLHFYQKFLEEMAETALVVRVSWEEFKDPVDTVVEVMRLYDTKKTGTVVLYALPSQIKNDRTCASV